jgi:hypothetical protein
MKEGTETNVKFKKLKRKLRLAEWQVIGLLEAVWKLARVSAPAGDVGRFSNEDIAASIEYYEDADELIAALVDCGWLVEDEEFRLIVNDWSEHVPTYLKGNFAKHNKQFADVVAKQRAKQVTKQPAKQGATKSSLVKPSQAKPSHSLSPGPISEIEKEDPDGGTTVSDGPRSKHFASEEFQGVWRSWLAKQERGNFQRMDPFTQEQQLYDLESMSTDDAIAIVRFSTGRTNCKNLILDGSHRRERDGPKRSGGSPGKGELTAAEIFGS